MKQDFFLGFSEEGFHQVAYLEWGRANSPDVPLICVHGLSRNSHDFDSLAEQLAQHQYHVYCPDVVGRGDSDWLKNPLHYTYEQYVADMTNLISHTGAHQVDWLGTSMGGLIGMFLASQPKTPIRRLILNDIGPQISVHALSRLAKYTGRDPSFKSIEEAKAYFKTIYADFGTLTEEQWQKLTEDSIYETAPGIYASKLDQGIKIAPARSKFAWKLLMHPIKTLEGLFFDVNLWDYWRKISCPVLVIHGKKSDILLPAYIEKMKSIHPDTEVLPIEDAGHAPALLDPVHQAYIIDWLDRKKV